MNKTGKNKLFMTIGLCVLLMIQMVVFIIFKRDAGIALWSMFSLIVLMALGAVLFSYMNLKALKERVSSLPVTYQDVYLDAQEIIGLSSMSKGMKTDTKAAVLEIFEHAAIDNRDVEDVIDNNLKTFMNGFLDAADGQYSIKYLMSYSILLFVGYILMMKLYKITRIGFSFAAIQTEKLDVGIVFTYALIAFIFFPWLMLIMKHASINRWSGLKRIWIMVPFIIPVGLLGILIGVDTPELRAILDAEMPIFDSAFKLMIGFVVVIASIVMMKWSRKIHLRE